MSTQGCCSEPTCEPARQKRRAAFRGPLLRRAARQGVKASGWALPGALLVLMPKCPMCVAAYVGIATGIGLSVSAAAHLRSAAMALCATSLGYVAAELAMRLMRTTKDKLLQ